MHFGYIQPDTDTDHPLLLHFGYIQPDTDTNHPLLLHLGYIQLKQSALRL
jgi:hypothetical protein